MLQELLDHEILDVRVRTYTHTSKQDTHTQETHTNTYTSASSLMALIEVVPYRRAPSAASWTLLWQKDAAHRRTQTTASTAASPDEYLR